MQKMPLEFDRAEGTSLVWNNGTRLKIENVFVSEGTWPRGSTWVSQFCQAGCCTEPPAPNLGLISGLHFSPQQARNPIPRVNDDNKGQPPASVKACPGPSGTSGPGCMQFPAPCPQDTGRYPWSTDGSGQGACSGDWTAGLVADRVIIPKSLPAGDYVLGWRWDCEN